MADTQRSLTDVLALLADNVSGNISPQDMRDMVVSIIPSGGSLYKSGVSALTVIPATNTPTLIVVETTAATNLRNFQASTAGRLTYQGNIDKFAVVNASIAFTGVGNNNTISFLVAKNGVAVAESRVPRFVATGPDVGALNLSWALSLQKNDYLEIFVQNETNDNDVTVEALFFAVTASLT